MASYGQQTDQTTPVGALALAECVRLLHERKQHGWTINRNGRGGIDLRDKLGRIQASIRPENAPSKLWSASVPNGYINAPAHTPAQALRLILDANDAGPGSPLVVTHEELFRIATEASRPQT